MKYAVPLSHYNKDKHDGISNKLDFQKVLDEKGKCLSVLNINNMIPVTDATMSVIQKLFYNEKKDNNPATVTIKEFVKWEDNPHIFGMYSKNTVLAIIPYSNYVKTVYGNHVPDNLCISYGIVTENHKEVLDEATLITITNILNTVSTGVTQRRKEFAMLKSVGMTPRGFKKMILLESSFYGIKATLWGMPISFLVCWLMTEILPTSGKINPNYGLFAIAVIVIFAIIWLSMLFSVSKLKKDTIVEVLKEEIS